MFVYKDKCNKMFWLCCQSNKHYNLTAALLCGKTVSKWNKTKGFFSSVTRNENSAVLVVVYVHRYLVTNAASFQLPAAQKPHHSNPLHSQRYDTQISSRRAGAAADDTMIENAGQFWKHKSKVWNTFSKTLHLSVIFWCPDTAWLMVLHCFSWFVNCERAVLKNKPAEWICI